MLKENELKIYKTIGKIHSTISTSKTFEQAIINGIKVILDNSVADYAIIWVIKTHENEYASPYYFICPFDISTQKRDAITSDVGKCLSSHQVITNNELHYEEIPDAGASCIVPFDLGLAEYKGCIEFIKQKEKGSYIDEEIDTCQLLVTLTEIEIKDNAPAVNYTKHKDILYEVKDVTKSYKSGDTISRILKGINFTVYKGEFLCLLGESGCGKTTIMNIIGGMIGADSGSVKFEGKEIIGLTSDELARYRRENIGFIFQSYNLMSTLTAKQNVQLIAELVKDPMDNEEALKLVNLEEKANNYPSQLSGGQQQRVSIARALVKKPKVIFADEPTAALDYETSIEVLTVLENILKTGTTLIMVTHNEEITKMASRVIRFKNGKVYETTVNPNPCLAKELVW